MTGFSFGGGSTCSLTEIAIDIVQVILGTVSALGQGFPVVITVADLAPDYGESHYIAPVRGAQPNSQAWVEGSSPCPWLVLNAYFARAYKEGRMPPIERDKIFIWAAAALKECHRARSSTSPTRLGAREFAILLTTHIQTTQAEGPQRQKIILGGRLCTRSLRRPS